MPNILAMELAGWVARPCTPAAGASGALIPVGLWPRVRAFARSGGAVACPDNGGMLVLQL